VVIPTRDRRETLLETLARVGDQAATDVEVIVVDDGSADGTPSAVRELSSHYPVPLRLLDRRDRAGYVGDEGGGTGPAAARNRGVEAARGSACLLLDDDVQPRAEMLARHLRFHHGHPDVGDALLGRVVPAPRFDSPFARWAHEHGAQFSYALLAAGKPVPPTCFWTAQVSVKTALMRDVGGFDEAFEGPFFEDVELAIRLERAGMRLGYDPDAVGEHAQAFDLPTLLARSRRSGPQFRALTERAPEIPLPRPPGWRHRVKARGLTALHAVGLRKAIRSAEWRFLLDEAQREAVWEGNEDGPLRIGAALERRVLKNVSN
jgi:GT2 family glycosyltransferase